MIMMMGTMIMIIQPQKLRHWLLKRICGRLFDQDISPNPVVMWGEEGKKGGGGLLGPCPQRQRSPINLK